MLEGRRGARGAPPFPRTRDAPRPAAADTGRMHAARSRRRGMPKLLLHCEAVSRVGDGSPSVRTRLEAVLGAEQAARLVGALANGRRGRAAAAP